MAILPKMPVKKAVLQQYIFLFFVTFLIRFPYFFGDVYDWDESTFILMGKSVADGHLPYVHLWDLKPPLIFYLIGLVQKIFPDSLAAIRFLGVIAIFISSTLILSISKSQGLRNGMLAALLYILFATHFNNLQGVMSEHLAVLFMLTGLYYFLRNKNRLDLFLSGIGFGCAIFSKLNYAYAILALLVYFFFRMQRKEPVIRRLSRSLLIASGILLTTIAIALPYILFGKTSLFIDSVFLASFEYGQTNNISLLKKLVDTLPILIITVLISYFAIKSATHEQKRVTTILIILLAGTVYTFFSIGKYGAHYQVQIFPFLFMLGAGVIIKRSFNPDYGILFAFVLIISFESIIEYYKVSSGYLKNSTLNHGKSYDIVDELKRRNLQDKKIYFATYHFAYWLLDEYPLTKSTTHPSNISRSFFFKYWDNPRNNTLDEVRYIMDTIRPDVVVGPDYLVGLKKGTPEAAYMKDYIELNFQQVAKDKDNKYIIWLRD